MRALIAFWVFLAGMLLMGPVAVAQEAVPAGFVEAVDRRIATLQAEVNSLKAVPQVRYSTSGGFVAFLFGAFCALWAQNTNRNSVLWFFVGAIFTVIAALVLLVKNSNDRERMRRERVMERRLADR